jgi:CheY-like chemotaxis protein
MVARIVVVEDEAAVRLNVVRTLSSRGYSVAAFERVTDAIPVVRAGGYDLLLVDVELPDGCGLDLIGMIPDGRAPAIVMSALGSERDFGRGFAAGAADYMGKPFTTAELLARVTRHLARSGPREDEPSLLFGRFALEKKLGVGGYGRVFLARDVAHGGERVAVKVLVPPPGDEEDAKRRFIRETLTLARVEHPGVVRVRDVGEKDGRVWFSMEHVPGETLADRILRDGPLGEHEARPLARGLLEALAAIHAQGVVHRDLKPANIILRGGDVAKPVLIDFGLSRQQREPSLTGTPVGTLPFMAPEVLGGEPGDARSDLFGLGLTLRYALVGEEVFPGLGTLALAKAMTTGPIPAASVPLTEPFGRLLAWLVEMDPRSRPPAASAAARALEAVERKEPLIA